MRGQRKIHLASVLIMLLPFVCFQQPFVRYIASVVILIAVSATGQAQTYSLVIGVDGLGPYGLQAASTPNLDKLMSGTWAGVGSAYRGAVANHAYAGGVLGTATQQATLSGPGWSSIHTGVWNNLHGVTDNSFSGSRYTERPSYLKILESQVPGIHTAGISSWNPINNNLFAPDGVNPNLDFRLGTNENDVQSTAAAVSQIARLSNSNRGAIFVHLDDVDIAGHTTGAYSSNYLTNINDIDSQVGSMLNAIKSRANFANENWQVVVVADHGHLSGGGHGGQTQMERTIPIIVSSQNTQQGLITADRRQPSMVDIPATVFNHFGVSAPAGQSGQALGQSVVGPSNVASLSNGLVSHLAFDGNTLGSPGTSGGTVVGNVQFTDGRFGQSVTVAQYGGGIVRLNQDLGALFSTNRDFAMSMWMKYESFTGDPAFFSNKNWNSGNNTGINLALQNLGGGSLDLNTKTDSAARQDIEPFGGLSAGEWQNLVFNVDRDGTSLLYVNGALFGEIALTSAGSFDGAFNWTFLNDGTGAYSQGSITGLKMDEFGAWNRKLTLDEISYLSQNSIQSVPEPSVGLLMMAASGAGVWWRSRSSRRSRPKAK
jgi:hypothetical protein